MHKKNSYPIYRLVIAFMLLLFSSISYGQWTLDVVGTVKKEENNKRFEGVTVTIKKNGAVWKTITSEAAGKFMASLEPDGIYLIEFSKPGHVTKRIEFSTKNVPPDDAKFGFEFPMEMNLFEKMEGLDVSILNKPIAKVAFNPATGYMDYDPEYTKSIKTELDRLKQELATRLKNQEAEQKAKQASYDKAILAADKAFTTQKWQEAKPFYDEAALIFPNETYPKTQLSAISDKLAAIEGANKMYNTAIAEGDKAFAEKKWDVATLNFQKAVSYKPTEKYPADKLNEIKNIVAAEKKNAEDYKIAIAAGDQFFSLKDYVKAKDSFTKAVALKSNEVYPKTKLTEIDKLIGDTKQKDIDYASAIAEADKLFVAKDYEKSKVSYNKALAVKSSEEYPKKKIAEADKFLGDQKKIEEDYKNAIALADQAFAAKDYPKAKTNYQQASLIKVNEKYPKDKMLEIESILGGLSKKDAEEKAKNKQYDDLIVSADLAFKSKSYESAKTSFNSALAIKANEKYPQDKIKEIDQILADLAIKKNAEESSNLAEKQKNEKYQAFIDLADKGMQNKSYDIAKTNYNLALGVKSSEKYPKDKLVEIENILSELAKKKASEETANAADKEKNEKYNNFILAADNDFKSTNYESAKTKYYQASAIKKDEQYPKDKLNEITKLLADLAKKNEDNKLGLEAEKKKKEYYNAVIAQAEGELIVKKYDEAKSKFTEASNILPDEKYPKTKIQEIDDILAKLNSEKNNSLLAEKEKNDKYNALIAQADNSLSAKDYINAKTSYKSALSFKPNEGYPKDKISEIDLILSDLAKNQAELLLTNNALKQKLDRYNSLLKKGDELFSKKVYKEALNSYNEAINIMPTEQYPKEKVNAINLLLANLSQQEKEQNDLAKQEKEKRGQYNTLIYDADRAFKFEKYLEAKGKYEQALSLYAEEKHPKEQLLEIETRMNKSNETIVVNNDPTEPRVKITDAKDKELEAMIADLNKNREVDKGIAVEKYKKEVDGSEAILVSSSHNKISTASTDLKGLENDMKTQYDEANKYHLENFDELNATKTELEGIEKTLVSTSENKRQKAKEDHLTIEESIRVFNTSQDKQLEEKVQELYAFADQVIESDLMLQEKANDRRVNNKNDIAQISDQIKQDVELGERRRKEREMKVDEYTKQLKDQENIFITRSLNKRNYNRDSLDEMVTAMHEQQLRNTKFYELNLSKIDEYKASLDNLEKRRVEASLNKRESSLRDVNEYEDEIKLSVQRQEQSYKNKTSYLQGYKDELADVDKQRVLSRKEYRENAKIANEKIEQNIKDVEASKSEYHLRFYETIQQERNKNDQFLADLNTLSYTKIRNVKPDDVYVGELKPSENLELSNKYPQGISEETTEEGNAVILRRIKVTGKHADVYEKIFYKWGGKFYTKNGYNITETLWNLESIEK